MIHRVLKPVWPLVKNIFLPLEDLWHSLGMSYKVRKAYTI